MEWWVVALIGLGGLLLLYGLVLGALLAAGRWSAAKAVARFLPDCLVLFERLLRDPRVPRGRKLLVAAMIAYIASPVDLILDAIPVIGLLDDAVLAALVLRSVIRGAGEEVVRQLWPGPLESLEVILAFGFGRSRPHRCGAGARAPDR